MIELAPGNKQGLALSGPLIVGSGGAGYGDAWPPHLTPGLFGALVTPPVTLAARKGTPQPRLAELPAGFLLATGGQNPGCTRIIAQYAKLWPRLGIPVLVALGGPATDWPELAARFEEQALPAGFELVLAPEDPLDTRMLTTRLAAVRRATTLPLLARLPDSLAEHVAVTCASSGMDALVIGTPPLATQVTPAGAWIEAPIAGPTAFPFTLRALRAVAKLALGLPLVASGGLYAGEDVARCLESGAVAVQVRSLLWSDPLAAARLAAALRSGQESQI